MFANVTPHHSSDLTFSAPLRQGCPAYPPCALSRASRGSRGPPLVGAGDIGRRGDEALIPHNTTVPTAKKTDSQPSVDIIIFQGERSLRADKKLLGRFLFKAQSVCRFSSFTVFVFRCTSLGVLAWPAGQATTGSAAFRRPGTLCCSASSVDRL